MIVNGCFNGKFGESTTNLSINRVYFDIAGPACGGPAVGPIWFFNHSEEEDFWIRVAQYQLDLQDMEEAEMIRCHFHMRCIRKLKWIEAICSWLGFHLFVVWMINVIRTVESFCVEERGATASAIRYVRRHSWHRRLCNHQLPWMLKALQSPIGCSWKLNLSTLR